MTIPNFQHFSIADQWAARPVIGLNRRHPGDQVMISGLLDLKGLRLMEKRIAGLKDLLAPFDDDDDDSDDPETVN